MCAEGGGALVCTGMLCLGGGMGVVCSYLEIERGGVWVLGVPPASYFIEEGGGRRLYSCVLIQKLLVRTPEGE